jgi:hypothetical protein
MKLTYRGISYNQPDQPVTTTPGAVMGNYRGAAWVARIVTFALKSPAIHTLCWRGVAYSTDGSPVAVAPAPEAAPVLPSPAKVQRQGENLADAHRQWIIKSLEHRLEVARNRGDQGLVQLLEDEWKQFA